LQRRETADESARYTVRVENRPLNTEPQTLNPPQPLATPPESTARGEDARVSAAARALIVTVDTEEDGAWDAGFRAKGNTVRNLQGLGRFQDHCERFAIRPTYLVDTPVVEDDAAAVLLRRWQDAGRCEVGAHLHPWCGPPFEESIDRRNSYMCNLPEGLQREKLARLTDAVERRIGRRPTSFRAGRYGLDVVGARILEQLGYVVDSSVIPFFDYTGQDGPDYRQAPFKPYRIGGSDLCAEDEAGRLLEVPVSVGFSWSRFREAGRIRQLGERPLVRPFRLVGLLDRLNLVRRIKFSPEQAGAADMRRLVDAYAANRSPAMVMMLHSASLVPGGSPYVGDAARLERLYDDLAETWQYCLSTRGMTVQTLTGFVSAYQQTRD